MTDFIVYGICADPECGHVYIEPPTGICPECGTTKPVMSPDLAAERHQRRKEGLDVQPIVIKPDADSLMMERFQDGMRTLRSIIHDEGEKADRLRIEADETSSREPGWRGMESEAKIQEKRVRELRKAERQLASLFLVEGSDNQEGWLGIDKKGNRSAPGPGDPCPRVGECEGSLKIKRTMSTDPTGRTYEENLLICDGCSAVIKKVQPAIVNEPPQELGATYGVGVDPADPGAYTGVLIYDEAPDHIATKGFGMTGECPSCHSGPIREKANIGGGRLMYICGFCNYEWEVARVRQPARPTPLGTSRR